MKETRYQAEDSSIRNARLTLFRILLWVTVAAIVLGLTLIIALHRRQANAIETSDPYARIPFRPKVTYDSLNVTVTNTEEEPYLNTSLNIYVGAILYREEVGTIRPGESVTRPLSSLTNEHGESFKSNSPRTSELEVRARFGGYDVHKDFPPPG